MQSFITLKGPIGKVSTIFLARHIATGQEVIILNKKEGKQDQRKNFSVVKHWNRLPRMVVNPHIWKYSGSVGIRL